MKNPIALAVNYSPQASELFRSGRVDFDCFKCPDWFDVLHEAQRQRPTYVHHELMAGQGQPRASEITNLHASIDSTTTPYINTHVAPLAGDLVEYPESERYRRAQRSVRTDVERLCNTFGAQRVIVENVPWETRSDYPIAATGVDPEFVSELLEETGALLLLDLAHARMAADELEMQIRPFVEAHPLHHLRELHVTGLGEDTEGRMRESMPMRESDWQLFVWALDQIAEGLWPRPWVITLEYGGVGPHFEWRTDIDALAEQLLRCGTLLRERGLRD
ncbi:MAG: DUF692 family multinuclear iron-containing protein [Candidatus Krumholzibacteria bacterium]